MRAEVVVSVRFTNRKAMRAMRCVMQALEEAGDAMEWRPELKRAAKAARYAAKHMAFVQEQSDG